ncbi:nicotinate-nucleotide diphosphorylase (carboxylating) [Sphingobacteriales bacterium UPWRP_1]|nr:nicotinate-nucleotide diphosphorylase (carboxylating) [Sphingobacteriales bacterium TSM_CSM]PSJ73737.1 nicotinate-nucleotide diphosphorylase (carboxylating) [Sphingobacteriales bacterium UPWRP_1]
MDITGFIQNALAEDIGNGDHTSLACIPANAAGKAKLIMKESGILAGMELAVLICREVDAHLELDVLLPDGAAVKYGDVGLTIAGRKQSILKAERLLLNCMQRMSGIATLTHQYVQAVAHTNARILDTRKTTPGFRYFEKWAVRIGGGHNHRMGLYDMIMIKDNHHDFCGGIVNAIHQTQQYLQSTGLNLQVEIEVRNLQELQLVLETGGVNRIMFDNFDVPTTRRAVEMVNGRFETESSGGIDLTTIRGYAETGVDFISAGALTHSYQSLDISLKAV